VWLTADAGAKSLPPKSTTHSSSGSAAPALPRLRRNTQAGIEHASTNVTPCRLQRPDFKFNGSNNGSINRSFVQVMWKGPSQLEPRPVQARRRRSGRLGLTQRRTSPRLRTTIGRVCLTLRSHETSPQALRDAFVVLDLLVRRCSAAVLTTYGHKRGQDSAGPWNRSSAVDRRLARHVEVATRGHTSCSGSPGRRLDYYCVSSDGPRSLYDVSGDRVTQRSDLQPYR